jgi:hypothetical protein
VKFKISAPDTVLNGASITPYIPAYSTLQAVTNICPTLQRPGILALASVSMMLGTAACNLTLLQVHYGTFGKFSIRSFLKPVQQQVLDPLEEEMNLEIFGPPTS